MIEALLLSVYGMLALVLSVSAVRVMRWAGLGR